MSNHLQMKVLTVCLEAELFLEREDWTSKSSHCAFVRAIYSNYRSSYLSPVLALRLDSVLSSAVGRSAFGTLGLYPASEVLRSPLPGLCGLDAIFFDKQSDQLFASYYVVVTRVNSKVDTSYSIGRRLRSKLNEVSWLLSIRKQLIDRHKHERAHGY